MALEHRLGVLVEKPLTLRIEEAERIRAQAETAGVPVLVNHTHLFSSAFAKLLELVPDLGNIRRLSGRAGNHGPYRPDVPVLWDWGPHDLAMCLAITGSSPQSVTAESLERKTVGDATAENLRIDLGFEDGVTADIVLSTLDPKCRRFAVFGDNGAALYDDLAPNKLTRFAPGVDVFSVAGRSGVPVPVEAEPPLSRAVRTFAEQLGESAFDPKNLDLAVEVVRVLEMCEASLNG
jgi:predicted dehydrogenase